MIEQPRAGDDSSEELLRRALLDSEDSAAVALLVDGLALCEELTIIFHGRRDLSTIQTYVALGAHGSGTALSGDELLRVPCDLDLADAEDRDDAEHLYAEQARSLRDALLAADTELSVWCGPLAEAMGSRIDVDRSIEINVALPAYRLMPVALVAPDRQLMIAPVCGARTLAEGRPPLGIACAQQDVAHVYPLFDDPERCLEDFMDRAHEHALKMADLLSKQEASVQRFLELNGEDMAEAG